MNTRAALHMVAAVAAALAGGTVAFAGVDDIVTKNIAAVAGLVSLAISTYLASTTTGQAR